MAVIAGVADHEAADRGPADGPLPHARADREGPVGAGDDDQQQRDAPEREDGGDAHCRGRIAIR